MLILRFADVMHPTQRTDQGATRLRFEDLWALAAVVSIAVVWSLIAYRPSELYFFGDTWDILAEFKELGWPTVWRMHNEHFMPVSKAVLYIQYGLFGMNNLPYEVINILIHAINAALLYVVAGDLTSSVLARVFGALFFAMSGVYWELTMWEAGQQTTLALLFLLLTLIFGSRYFRNGGVPWMIGAALTALLASWSMGFGLLAVPLLMAQALVSGSGKWKRGLALCALAAAIVLMGFAVLLMTDRTGLSYARHSASLSQALQVIPWTYVALRGLAASYAAPLSASLLAAVVLSLAGLFFWRSFLSVDRLRALAVPLALLFLPYALTAVGRVKLGFSTAASSRYQYLPAAALGLLLAWVLAGFLRIAENRRPKAALPLAILILLTLTLHAAASYRYLRTRSPMLEWGRQAHRFVRLAIEPQGPSAACIQPELYLPLYMYPYPFYDLSRALPLYGVQPACTVKLGTLLGARPLAAMNLLEGAQGQGYRGAAAALGEEGSVRINLPPTAAYGFDVPCTNTTHPVTFAASAELISGDGNASLRISLKDQAGNILETYSSPPIGVRNFTPLVVSALPTRNTAIISVDVNSALQATIAMKDAILLQHPVYLPESLLQKKVADEHGIDSGRVEAAHGVARRTH